MSASLVGSEMCIRDRSKRWLIDGRDDGVPAGARRSRSQGLSVRCAVAVSYTHLTLPTICSV
eukprot:3262518-Alexandrium_andersonii.AAC.1